MSFQPLPFFLRSVRTWKLFLQRNTFVLGQDLLQPITKVQARKNRFGFPRPDVILSRFLSNALLLWSRAKNTLKFVTATFVLRSAAVIRKLLLLLLECC